VGALLVFAGLLGAAVWVISLTPIGFARFRLIDGDRIENYRSAGTYVVFEERNGAGDPLLPPPISVSVTSQQGDVVPVEQLIKPYQRSSPYVYSTPWQQGRAIARFTIDEPGSYYVRSLPVGGSSLAGYGSRRGGTRAIGRDLALSWLGGWAGLAVLCGVPVLAGIGCVVMARRRRLAAPPAADAMTRPPAVVGSRLPSGPPNLADGGSGTVG
jgi:hypothetical protein